MILDVNGLSKNVTQPLYTVTHLVKFSFFSLHFVTYFCRYIPARLRLNPYPGNNGYTIFHTHVWTSENCRAEENRLLRDGGVRACFDGPYLSQCGGLVPLRIFPISLSLNRQIAQQIKTLTSNTEIQV